MVSLYLKIDFAAIRNPTTSSFPIITNVNTKIRSKIPISFPAFLSSIVVSEMLSILPATKVSLSLHQTKITTNR
ncbi:hypothetical protein IA01_08880 [Flavobacterium psychrophilum]|nr:hypothetical protein IA03_08850 [Flavobacterium psychrophilum]AIN72809.1 hypothetical protein FPG101_04790 [Flavobacterium psychrophilum FPG101]ROO23001.1 hypothetical protein FPG104_01740 [Flavobacterium psychrophilum 10]AIG32846.1 hypothetical protein IA01_08880 [Flavobacterium psychrophilum]AIG35001.1 hypothetical protein IA02_08265 [Flavobacterium psychrophilum]